MLNRNSHNLENSFYKFHKRFLTLIEMLIVITILVLFTGVIGINIGAALREQRFNSEVDLIVERLRLAQSLMLITNKDVSIVVRGGKDKEGIDLSMEVEGGVPKDWQFIVDRSHIVLTTIHSFLFEDLLNYPIKPGEIEIRFLSGGVVMSRGVVRLSTHEKYDTSGALRSAIPLLGYPHPIMSVSENDKLLQIENGDKESDAWITANTIEELKQYAVLQTGKKTHTAP